MNDIAHLLQDPATTIAVVGATNNRHKYGSIIYRDLKAKGFTVFPVNNHRGEVDGDTAYPSLSDLPQSPTIVNIVVPAKTTIEVLKEALELGYTNVWVQPGAESSEIYEFLETHEFNALVGACIMVRSHAVA